jgi:hypothetical protein
MEEQACTQGSSTWTPHQKAAECCTLVVAMNDESICSGAEQTEEDAEHRERLCGPGSGGEIVFDVRLQCQPPELVRGNELIRWPKVACHTLARSQVLRSDREGVS